jgi:hypothetical protein
VQRLRGFVLSSCSILTLACGGGGRSADDDGEATESTSGADDDASSTADASATMSASIGTDDETSVGDDSVESSDEASVDSSESSSDGGSATIDVAGHVTSWHGRPVAGASVTIAGTTATTAEDGTFAIAGVAVPYEARVDAEDMVTVVRELTRADPSLHTYGGFVDLKQADIEGTLSGGAGFPSPAGHEFAVSFDGFDTHEENWSYSMGPGPDYHISPRWYGPVPAEEGTVMVLQWEELVNGQPLGYDALGTFDIAVSDGGVFAEQDIVLAPVADSIVGGSLVTPDGADVSQVRLFVGTGDIASVFAGWQEDAFDSYEFLVPQGQGAYAGLSYIAGSNDAYVFAFRTDVAPGTMDADLEIPTLPSWTAPINGSNGFGLDTELAWSGIADAVSVITVYCEEADAFVRVVTAEATATIPDVSDLGVQFPPSSTCHVVLDQYAPLASTDEWAGPDSPMRNRSRVDSSYPSTPLFDGSTAVIENLQFSTAP